MPKKKDGRQPSSEQHLSDRRKDENLPAHGSLLDDVMPNLSPAERADLLRKMMEKGLEMEVQKREKAEAYLTARQELDDLSVRFEEMSHHTGLRGGVKIKQEFKTASGKAEVTARSGTACFVATAIYGSPEAAQVRYLRTYRDQVLLQTAVGTRFVDWYYHNGLEMANFIDRHPILRRPTELIIGCLISLIRMVKGDLRR